MKISQTDWAQMPYFLAVARAKSLRQAAISLGTTHLKVNRHLHALEAAFGVDLVHRGHGGIKLTPAGETLLPIAEEAEAMFVDAQRALHGLDNKEKGIVRFSVSGPIAYHIVAPIIAAFTAKYPQIELVIHVSTAMEDPRLTETDVSLRMVYQVNEDAIVKKLFPIGLGTFATKDYLEAHFRDAGPKGEGLHWIGAGRPDTKPDWVMDSPFPNAEVRHRLGDPTLHHRLAQAGLGMTRLAAMLVAEDPDMVLVPRTEIEPGPPLSLIIHPQLRRTTRVRRFVDFLEQELRRQRNLIQFGQRLSVS